MLENTHLKYSTDHCFLFTVAYSYCSVSAGGCSDGSYPKKCHLAVGQSVTQHWRNYILNLTFLKWVGNSACWLPLFISIVKLTRYMKLLLNINLRFWSYQSAPENFIFVILFPSSTVCSGLAALTVTLGREQNPSYLWSHCSHNPSSPFCSNSNKWWWNHPCVEEA